MFKYLPENSELRNLDVVARELQCSRLLDGSVHSKWQSLPDLCNCDISVLFPWGASLSDKSNHTRRSPKQGNQLTIHRSRRGSSFSFMSASFRKPTCRPVTTKLVLTWSTRSPTVAREIILCNKNTGSWQHNIS